MTALNVLRSLGMVVLLTVAALGQSISQASGSLSSGMVSVNTTAPARYTSVTIKVTDKDGNVILTFNTTPGAGASFESSVPGATLKVYATFKKANGDENIQGPKEVTWS